MGKVTYGIRIIWHRLRHEYATLLKKHCINEKKLASLLVHCDGTFTLKTYVDTASKICEGVPEYFQMLEDILPVYSDDGKIMLKTLPPVLSLPSYEKFLDTLVRGLLINPTNTGKQDERTNAWEESH